MGIWFDSMFGGRTFMPIKLYWSELNQQIVERRPRWYRLNDFGIGGYGYEENDDLTYIGNLDDPEDK
jgi:hypothetical protein